MNVPRSVQRFWQSAVLAFFALAASKALSSKLAGSPASASSTQPRERAPFPDNTPVRPGESPRSTALPRSEQRSGGAWVWNRSDAEVLARAREVDPWLRAAVLVATIDWQRDGRPQWHRALSPQIGRGSLPGAIVIRFDDSMHGVWNDAAPGSIAERLGAMVAQVLEEARGTGATFAEIELDYDAPIRALAPWADVVGQLSRRFFAGRSLWVTSLPSHLRAASYGDLFAGAGVAGHILQLFDTGLACTGENADLLAGQLARHHLPFRIGVAAFERTGTARRGDHACWQSTVSRFATVPGYAGFWIFPAGREMRSALARLSAEVR